MVTECGVEEQDGDVGHHRGDGEVRPPGGLQLAVPDRRLVALQRPVDCYGGLDHHLCLNVPPFVHPVPCGRCSVH